MQNPYLDMYYVDRTDEIDAAFEPTLKGIKADPQFYAELVNDLMFHWIYGTKETALMVMARKNMFEQLKTNQ